MKYAFIAQHADRFEVEKMCRTLKVSRSGYYSYGQRGISTHDMEDNRLRIEIRAIFNRYKGRVGSPAVTEWLRRQGEPVGENRVARLMQEMGLMAKGKRKFRHTTDSNHDLPIAQNHLDRKFAVSAPNKVWVSDITYIPTREGWLYLCVFVDLFSRLIVGYAIEDNMRTGLVTKALERAYWRRMRPLRVLVHSDRGSQYASLLFRDRLTAYGMTQSMSRRGNCWDNAVGESFFHTLKVELVHGEDFQTRQEAKEKITEYIELYYNSVRLHSTLGMMSPREFEQQECA
jgi:transposase InsO family protein